MAGTVAAFVDAADDVLRTVAQDLDVPLDQVMRELIRSWRAGKVPQIGSTKSGVAFSLHGIGCRFEDGGGGEVDLDMSPDGAPMFDAWRIRQWTESLGLPEPAVQEIEGEAGELGRAGSLHAVRPGWWTWSVGSGRTA